MSIRPSTAYLSKARAGRRLLIPALLHQHGVVSIAFKGGVRAGQVLWGRYLESLPLLCHHVPHLQSKLSLSEKNGKKPPTRKEEKKKDKGSIFHGCMLLSDVVTLKMTMQDVDTFFWVFETVLKFCKSFMSH